MNKEHPSSIDSIEWSQPLTVEVVRADYSVIPNESGVYVFTTRDTAIRADTGVLYVGKAAQLRRRLRAYLKSPFDILLLSPTKRDGALSRSLRQDAPLLAARVILHLLNPLALIRNGMFQGAIQMKFSEDVSRITD